MHTDGMLPCGGAAPPLKRPPRVRRSCLVKYSPDYAGMPFNGSLVIATYCVPTRPGWVRPLANVLLDSEATMGWTMAEQALAVFVNYPLPPWVGHILSSIVLHQDSGLLYGQSRNLRARGYNFARKQPLRKPPLRTPPAVGPSAERALGSNETASSDASEGSEGSEGSGASDASGGPLGSGASDGHLDLGGVGESAVEVEYERLAFCPTPSDKAVLSFRDWCRKHGGAGIPWQCDDVLVPQGTEDIFDMWEAHTTHCSQCRAALMRIEFIKYTSLSLALASVVAMPYGWERALTATFLLAVPAALHAMSGMFYRYEYSHADAYGPLDYYLDLVMRAGTGPPGGGPGGREESHK